MNMRNPVRVPRPIPRVRWENVVRIDGMTRRVMIVNFMRVNCDTLRPSTLN